MAGGLLTLVALAVAFAVVVGSRGIPAGAAGQQPAVPIDPGNAAPDTVLAEVPGDVSVSTPIRPDSLQGLGYHPEGEGLAEMEPRGENLSAGPFRGLFARGETSEGIRYHVMDPAGREGPGTGALDVGAEAGTVVHAPATGVVTAIRPDLTVRDAVIVEIKPLENPDVRVAVSLVKLGDGPGVNAPVTAGATELGTVADSAKVLDSQLSSYVGGAGNHVTVSVSKAG